jgi:aspartyl-tRNA(Asn)/glutamyl-tRNA(Gln) amidotransferase subunit A
MVPMDALKEWREVLTVPEKRERYSTYVDTWEKKIGSLIEFDFRDVRPITDGPLSGVPFAVKDNIAVKGFRLTCGSKILEPLVSSYTATSVARLQAAGAVVVAKTNLDEFGMGSSTDNSALADSSNPFDLSRVCGGSSGGSAAAVAAGIVPFALGSDTGGSIRQPASFCGVYGLKPTYGAVSRFGLVAYASSLDVVGALARDPEVLKTVFEIARGQDEADQSSIDYPDSDGGDPPKRIGVLAGLSDLSPTVAAAYNETREKLRDLGFTLVDIELPTLDYVVPAYYTIATAEASANLARYNGIRYGNRVEADRYDELVKQTRTQGFGEEVKLRILLGTYVLRSGFQDQYYIRAQKIRTAISNDFSRAFETVDLIMMPVFPTLAFKHGSDGLTPFQQKLADKFTASANLAGIPSLAFPTGISEGLPVGLQLLGPPRSEERIFTAALNLKNELPEVAPPGFDATWRG